MFTGIVKEIGTIEAVERTDDGARLRIAAGFTTALNEGDSVAVGGVCLTATDVTDSDFAADVMNQTLSLTSLGESAVGDRVNLEPALRAGDPLGGHLVQGHVDCRGTVEGLDEDGFARRLSISVPAEYHRYLVEHGSITVDGVSLTVANLTDDGFEVSLIPETLDRTTLGGAGRSVNLEFDVVARYVERLLGFKEGSD